MKPFRPTVNATVNIDVSSSNQVVKVANCAGDLAVRIANLGTATVWISYGASAAIASVANSTPIPSGTVEVMTFQAPDGSALYIAAIAAGTTGVIYFTPGIGI